MQAVRTDHQIEIACAAAVERQAHTVGMLVDRGDTVTKHRFDAIFNGGVDRRGQIATRHAGISALGNPTKRVNAEGRSDPAVGGDRANRFDLIAGVVNGLTDPHLLRDVIPDTPKIDHIPAGAKSGRPLDQGRLVASPVQPVREGWASNAGTTDGDLHADPPTSRIGPLATRPAGRSGRKASVDRRLGSRPLIRRPKSPSGGGGAAWPACGVVPHSRRRSPLPVPE